VYPLGDFESFWRGLVEFGGVTLEVFPWEKNFFFTLELVTALFEGLIGTKSTPRTQVEAKPSKKGSQFHH
jgi:hypothetical protein